MPIFCGSCYGCTFETTRPDTDCRYGSNCTRDDCHFAHASPAGNCHMAGNEPIACRHGIKCKRGNCSFAHPSPSLGCDGSSRSDSESDEYTCNHCGKGGFKSQRALDQHKKDAKGHRECSRHTRPVSPEVMPKDLSIMTVSSEPPEGVSSLSFPHCSALERFLV
jgi:hypothetical protein